MKYLKVFNIFEARQRANLYHIFDLTKCLFILYTNSLKSFRFSNISTTRNKNMNGYLGDCPTSIFKLELNGDKLTNKYKIKPFSYVTTEIGWGGERNKKQLIEYEEVILTNEISNINKYVNKFIIIKEKVEYLKNSGWFDSDGGYLNKERETIPNFFKTQIPKIKELFGGIWVQDGFIIKKDDEWINSIINFPIKKINHGYALYFRGYKPTGKRYGGYIDYVTPINDKNNEIDDFVIGYEYDNLYLNKIKKFPSLPKKQDYKLYIFDFEYELEDIIKQVDNEVYVKKAKLNNIRPL